LIDLASGDLEASRRHYKSARKAFEDSEPDFARLIDSWRLAAEWHFGYRDDSGLGAAAPSEDDCRYVVLRDAFKRPTWRRRGGQGTRPAP